MTKGNTDHRSGPVILVTGASSGIGAATAKHFGAQGYKVVLAARRLERLQEVAQEVRKEGGEALSVQTDVTELSQLQHLVDCAERTYGRVDILVNNAGMGRLKWLDELDPGHEITDQIAVNLTGSIQLTRLVLPGMMERRQGHIIHVSSVAAWVAPPTYSVYTATKFGMKGFIESLRREVGAFGIHVGAVYPGPVATEFDEHAGVSWDTENTTPSWMLLQSEDVARAIFRLVKTKKKRRVIPRIMQLAIWGNMIFPGLVDWVLSRYFYRREGESITWGEPT